MLSDLPFTLTALRGAYAAGTSPVAIVDEVFARLERIHDTGIFIHLCDQEALRAEAAALGPYNPEMPLWGIPFAVKDNIDVGGIETTAGCPAFAFQPPDDAFVVGKLRAAGGLMIGKTNLDQFATGLVGIRTPYGAPLNAIDPAIIPGGSSGGSAVVVAHGAVCFALGTDTAGSGRVPAALNNVVGLKPSLGALSATGVVPACRTLDTVSIFALTVDDAYAAFAVARGYDAKDAYCKPFAATEMTEPPAGLRVGIPDATSIEFFGDVVQAETFARDCAHLTAIGAAVEEIDFTPLFQIADMLYQGAWVAERYTVIDSLLQRDPEAIFPVTREIIAAAETMSAADAFQGFYRLAELKRVAEPILQNLDVICVPTIPKFYSVSELQARPIAANAELGRYTNFVNLLDMCGIAVPTATRRDGRPGSVTLLAQSGDDAAVAALARRFEADCPRNLGATTHILPSPRPLTPAPCERIDVAVCGAHMTGLPLNPELTARDGQFQRTAKTSPYYQFYALAGGPPARPGLVRTSSAQGAGIALEIWSLPKSALGDFMGGIPAPLGIGSIELAEGTWVKGFLCEAVAVNDAVEITDLGDWRVYLEQLSASPAHG